MKSHQILSGLRGAVHVPCTVLHAPSQLPTSPSFTGTLHNLNQQVQPSGETIHLRHIYTPKNGTLLAVSMLHTRPLFPPRFVQSAEMYLLVLA